MRLTSEILRDQINAAYASESARRAEGFYAMALCERDAIYALEKAYDKALKREKKEARKGWWGR